MHTWKPKRDFSMYAMQCASLMHPPSADCEPLRSHAMNRFTLWVTLKTLDALEALAASGAEQSECRRHLGMPRPYGIPVAFASVFAEAGGPCGLAPCTCCGAAQLSRPGIPLIGALRLIHLDTFETLKTL